MEEQFAYESFKKNNEGQAPQTLILSLPHINPCLIVFQSQFSVLEDGW
jgi:hypothetical protein